VLIYETDGTTEGGSEQTTNFHYFTELAQRAIKLLSQPGPLGKLYSVDMRLRPTGKSGSLVVPLVEFRRYFAGGGAQLWERQALTRARGVRGDSEFLPDVLAAVHTAILGHGQGSGLVEEVRTMRDRLETTASPRSMKLAPGGLTDIEFIVQLLQLKHGAVHPAILRPNVWDALHALEIDGLLRVDEANTLREGYSFLRCVEARVRVMTDRATTTLPEAVAERAKLAKRFGFDAAEFPAELKRMMSSIRRVYRSVTERERQVR